RSNPSATRAWKTTWSSRSPSSSRSASASPSSIVSSTSYASSSRYGTSDSWVCLRSHGHSTRSRSITRTRSSTRAPGRSYEPGTTSMTGGSSSASAAWPSSRMKSSSSPSPASHTTVSPAARATSSRASGVTTVTSTPASTRYGSCGCSGEPVSTEPDRKACHAWWLSSPGATRGEVVTTTSGMSALLLPGLRRGAEAARVDEALLRLEVAVAGVEDRLDRVVLLLPLGGGLLALPAAQPVENLGGAHLGPDEVAGVGRGDPLRQQVHLRVLELARVLEREVDLRLGHLDAVHVGQLLVAELVGHAEEHELGDRHPELTRVDVRPVQRVLEGLDVRVELARGDALVTDDGRGTGLDRG